MTFGQVMRVADNSGGRLAKCIRERGVKLGEITTVVIKQDNPNVTKARVKRSDVTLARVIRTKTHTLTRTGMGRRADDGAACILMRRGDEKVIGTRLMQRPYYEYK
eukprot:Clim_evm88s88 gene=Clim_evmTU88s88